jgi:hypothetical protein
MTSSRPFSLTAGGAVVFSDDTWAILAPVADQSSLWKDLGIPLLLAVAATAIAAAWPSWQAHQRRRRFEGLMRRELQEIGPLTRSPEMEWWQHLSQRFIHEEFFRPQNATDNRDFLLSMHPSLVYHASQLWIAFEKHDLKQWLRHLRQLLQAEDLRKRLSSDKAQKALESWNEFTTFSDRRQ